jgi:hypothetical protein
VDHLACRIAIVVDGLRQLWATIRLDRFVANESGVRIGRERVRSGNDRLTGDRARFLRPPE